MNRDRSFGRKTSMYRLVRRLEGLRLLSVLVILFTAIALLDLPGFAQSKPGSLTEIVHVSKDSLLVRRWAWERDSVILLSNIVLSDTALATVDPLGTMYFSPVDFRVKLLERGLARLSDTLVASRSEREAERSARKAEIGIWQTIGEDPVTRIWSALKWIIGGALTLGLGGWVAYYLRNRRVDLLFTGEPGAGKTALLKRVVNSGIPKQELLNIQATRAAYSQDNQPKIPMGKLEVHPRVTDVPGSAYGTLWDMLIPRFPLWESATGGHKWDARLLRRSQVIVAVLAPSPLQSPIGSVDQDYVNVQLGAMRSYVVGALQSQKARTPRLVILFINKFDLISSVPPGDSAAGLHESSVKAAFRDHIAAVRDACSQRNVPFAFVIGSAVEGWQTGRVIEILREKLYV